MIDDKVDKFDFGGFIAMVGNLGDLHHWRCKSPMWGTMKKPEFRLGDYKRYLGAEIRHCA